MSAPLPLLAPDDLAASARFRVLDASWIYPKLNEAGIDVRQRYAEAHLPGALFLDLAALSLPYPNAPDVPALRPPHPDTLRRLLAAEGIGPATPLVVTDFDGGTTTAPFARLALIDAGFADVLLLDGGNAGWAAAGLALTAERPRFVTGAASTPTDDGRFVSTATTWQAIACGAATVVDARAMASNDVILPARFAEVEIPTDVVLRPGEVVVEAAEGQRFRSPAELAAIARTRGIARNRPSIITCHFGLGAAAVATALEIAGHPAPAVDAASILGWATEPSRPS